MIVVDNLETQTMCFLSLSLSLLLDLTDLEVDWEFTWFKIINFIFNSQLITSRAGIDLGKSGHSHTLLVRVNYGNIFGP